MRNAQWPAWCLAAFGLLSATNGRAAEVHLETTRVEQKIPIWVMGFRYQGAGKAPGARNGELMTGVLKADLKRTGLFTVIDKPGAARKFSQAHCRSRESVAAVEASRILLGTWGRVRQHDGKLIMESCAYEHGTQKVVAGRWGYRRPSTVQALRFLAHQWADALVSHYTGERGIARTKIVYLAENKTGLRGLYVMDYDGFGARRIMATRALMLSPAWVSDRRSVVYTTYRKNNQEIVRLHLASGRKQRLVRSRTLNMTPAVSPDGQRLAYASTIRGNSDIFMVDMGTLRNVRLTSNKRADLSPTWSPSGRQMAFTSDRGGGPQIYVMNADGSGVRRLTFQGRYNAAPVWSPRGNWIAYVCLVPRTGFKLCRIDPNGRRLAQITTGRGAVDDSPSWAPDGRHLVFSSARGGRSHLYIIHFDGTGLERLTKGAWRHSAPAWSPSAARRASR